VTISPHMRPAVAAVAKMTSTYERIRSESQEYRALQHAQFILEFKDERSAPPPLNLLTFTLACLPSCFTRRTGLLDSLIPAARPRGFAVAMGHAASVRLQTREREYAQAFHTQRMRDASCSTSGRIAAIHNDLPTLRSLGKQCEALESEIVHLRAQHEVDQADIHAKLDELLASSRRTRAPAPEAAPAAASESVPDGAHATEMARFV
jgi:hypothetical protein